MAATALTPVDVARSGVDTTGAAANADGNYFTNTGAEALFVTNASANPITVTIVTQKTVDGLAVADRTVSVPNAKTYAIGPFDRATYNDTSAYVQITYSAVTSVTVKVLRLTPTGS